jgi:hypothetical protein
MMWNKRRQVSRQVLCVLKQLLINLLRRQDIANHCLGIGLRKAGMGRHRHITLVARAAFDDVLNVVAALQHDGAQAFLR